MHCLQRALDMAVSECRNRLVLVLAPPDKLSARGARGPNLTSISTEANSCPTMKCLLHLSFIPFNCPNYGFVQ